MRTKITDIKRIIYWWRRYMGWRNKEYGKVWLSSDLDVLEKRIIEYINHPDKFKFDYPDMGIDIYGFPKGEKHN